MSAFDNPFSAWHGMPANDTTQISDHYSQRQQVSNENCLDCGNAWAAHTNHTSDPLLQNCPTVSTITAHGDVRQQVNEKAEIPALPKPLTSSKHWDAGIDWPLAGERAARLEREDQLRESLERITTLTAEVAALKAELARRSAPVTDAEWTKHYSMLFPRGTTGTDRAGVDALILARATPPQDAEKIGGGE